MHGDMHQEERVDQEDHQFPTPEPARHAGNTPLPVSFPPGPGHSTRTKKTIFDAWNGYHFLALSKEDRYFTTFITPWGRYRYLTARYDALVANVRSKTKCIDDALIWSDDITGAFHQATEWLHICAVNGITLNPRKFHFAEDTVEFAGFIITPSEVKPADKYTQSITDFQTSGHGLGS